MSLHLTPSPELGLIALNRRRGLGLLRDGTEKGLADPFAFHLPRPYSLRAYLSNTLGGMKSGDVSAECLSERIRFELFTRHVSAAEIAHLLGRDVKTVHRHLRGETAWPVGEIWKIAGHLEIPVSQLTGKDAHE